MLRAYSWTRAGDMISIPPLPCGENSDSIAGAVNNGGQVVGVSGVAVRSDVFMWTSAAAWLIGAAGSAPPLLPLQSAMDQQAGTVVSEHDGNEQLAGVPSGLRAAAWWISAPWAARHSIANDVNDAGVVVGSTATACGRGSRLRVDERGRDGRHRDNSAGTESRAFRINSAGAAVGQRRFTDGNFQRSGGRRPAAWSTGHAGGAHVRGPVSGARISTTVVDRGGHYCEPRRRPTPVLVDARGRMVPITSVTPGVFGRPSAINNIGNVVGTLSGFRS